MLRDIQSATHRHEVVNWVCPRAIIVSVSGAIVQANGASAGRGALLPRRTHVIARSTSAPTGCSRQQEEIVRCWCSMRLDSKVSTYQ